jgi:hypothetical protein
MNPTQDQNYLDDTRQFLTDSNGVASQDSDLNYNDVNGSIQTGKFAGLGARIHQTIDSSTLNKVLSSNVPDFGSVVSQPVLASPDGTAASNKPVSATGTRLGLIGKMSSLYKARQARRANS